MADGTINEPNQMVEFKAEIVIPEPEKNSQADCKFISTNESELQSTPDNNSTTEATPTLDSKLPAQASVDVIEVVEDVALEQMNSTPTICSSDPPKSDKNKPIADNGPKRETGLQRQLTHPGRFLYILKCNVHISFYRLSFC
uniref:Uncharacterized protein n=1 Tax=Parascaris equorum TaxID=6256 RepID=A0A914S213_PAREQ